MTPPCLKHISTDLELNKNPGNLLQMLMSLPIRRLFRNNLILFS